MLEIEIIKGGVEIITSLANDWIGLCDEGASRVPFLRPEWFAALLANFKKRTEVITVRRNGNLRAILPLMRSKDKLHGLPVRKLQAVFNPNSPCFDIVHSPDEGERTELVGGIWKQLKEAKGWDVFECRLVKGGSWLEELLAHARREGHSTGIWPMDRAPYITVPTPEADGSINSYFSGSRKHLKKELSRRLKRLKESGEVRFAVTKDFRPETIDRFLEVENRGWKGRAGTAAIQDGKAAALHADFARSMAREGNLLIYELLLDSRTIAMCINIKYGERLFHWKTTYDEEYSRFSPGNLLFNRLLIDSSVEGIREIDFLCPELPYKKVWSTGARDHVALYIFRRSITGWMAWVWKFMVISRLRTLKTTYPALVKPFTLKSA